MSGLILKDFLSLRRYIKSAGIFLLIYNILFIATNQTSIAVIVTVYLLANLPISVFAYDESSHWDLYARSLPLSHKQIVLSRYLTAGISLAAGILIGTVIFCVDIALHSVSENAVAAAGTIIGTAFSSMFVQLLTIPLIYRFGVQRGRIFLLVGFAILFAAAVVSVPFLKLCLSYVPAAVVSGAAAILILLAGAVISYRVSCHIYERN